MQSSVRRMLADDGTAIVTVHGEIDFDNAGELARGVREAVLQGSPPAVQVDLRDANLVDSSGLGALIEGFQAASEAGVRFVVTNPTPTFRRVLTVTGLTEFFGLTEAEGALAAAEGSERGRIGNDPRRGRRGPSEDSAPGGSSRIISVIAGGATTEGRSSRTRP